MFDWLDSLFSAGGFDPAAAYAGSSDPFSPSELDPALAAYGGSSWYTPSLDFSSLDGGLAAGVGVTPSDFTGSLNVPRITIPQFNELAQTAVTNTPAADPGALAWLNKNAGALGLGLSGIGVAGGLLNSLIGGGGANIPAPPPAPSVPARSTTDQIIAATMAEFFQQDARTQAAIRAAIEQQFGKPFEQVVAEQATAQATLQTQTQDLQRQILEAALNERAAFKAATGKFPEELQAEEAAARAGLVDVLNEQYIKAAKGELPLPPAVEQQKATELQVLQETLRKNGIPLGSTPYEEALSKFHTRWDAIEGDYKRGLLSQAQAFSQSGSPFVSQEAQGLATGLASAGGPQSPLGTTMPFAYRGNLASSPAVTNLLNMGAQDQSLAANFALAGYAPQVAYTTQLGNLNYQTALADAQSRAGLYSGLMNLGTNIYSANRIASALPGYAAIAGMR